MEPVRCDGGIRVGSRALSRAGDRERRDRDPLIHVGVYDALTSGPGHGVSGAASLIVMGCEDVPPAGWRTGCGCMSTEFTTDELSGAVYGEINWISIYSRTRNIRRNNVYY